MIWHVRRSRRPSKIVKTDKAVALFASMIAVFYDDAVMANGYGKTVELYSPYCSRCRASQVKANQ